MLMLPWVLIAAGILFIFMGEWINGVKKMARLKWVRWVRAVVICIYFNGCQ